MKAFKLLTLLALISCASSPSSSYQTGKASWYGKKYHGRKTASGQVYNMFLMTAAHQTLPFGTKVKVISERTGKEVIVRINDRGPFVDGRIIDLSKKAARKLGILEVGEEPVKLVVLD